MVVAVALYLVGKISVGMRLMKHIVAGVMKILPTREMPRMAPSGSAAPNANRQQTNVNIGSEDRKKISEPNLRNTESGNMISKALIISRNCLP